MTVMEVLKFPHPTLKQKAKPVTEFNRDLTSLSDAMLETMYKEGGIGLAAIQVGVLKRLVVTDLGNNTTEDEENGPGAGPDTRKPRVFVNPVLLSGEGEVITEEGCLSVVEFTAEVRRYQRIKVGYRTLKGEKQQEVFEDLEAICLQHEMDHLDGKLFIDHLPPVKRQVIKKRLAKLAKSA